MIETAPSDKPKMAVRSFGFLKQFLKHLPFLIVLGLFIFWAGSYSQNVPLWETPDEPDHFAYVQYIKDTGGPPIQSFEEGKNKVVTGHHPPLYYFLGALLTSPTDSRDFSKLKPNKYFSFSNSDGGINVFDNTNEQKTMQGAVSAAHAVRWLSIAFSAGTLICIYLAGLLVFGGPSWAGGGRAPATAAAAFAGLLPQFAFLSGAINNDNAVIFFCALSLYLCMRLALFQRKPAWWEFAGLGAVIGLGMLAKYNEIVFIPQVGVAVGLLAWRLRSWKVFWQGALISGAACIAVSGWWFVRSQLLYGDPAGWSMWRSSFKSAYSDDFKWTWAALDHFWSRWFDSWWGVFGWFNVRFEPEIYSRLGWASAFLAVCSVGLILTMVIGFSWGKIRKKPLAGLAADRRMWVMGLFCGLTLTLVGISALNYAASFGDAGTQGRYLFPALPALALLVGGGLGWLIGWLRFSGLKWLAGGVSYSGLAVGVVVLVLLNQHALYNTILPAYTTPEVVIKDLPTTAIRSTETKTFWPNMYLLAYEIEPQTKVTAKPGSFKLTLYWQAQRRTEDNFVLFVHLLDGTQFVTGADGPPGFGRFQTYKWGKANIIKDERTLTLTPEAAQQIKSSSNPIRFMLGWTKSPGGERAQLENTKTEEIYIDWK